MALIRALIRVQPAQVPPLVVLWREVNRPIERDLPELRRKVLAIVHQNGIDLHIVGEVDYHGFRALAIALLESHVQGWV